jgi:hypothetical protein
MSRNKIAAISIIKLQSDITDVKKDLAVLRSQSAAASGSVMKLGANLKNLIVGSAVVQQLKSLGMALIDNARRFEKYTAMLKVATGSSRAASKEFERLRQLAIGTPSTVDELTKSFVLFMNRGINPTNKQMMAMSDLSSSLGRTFEDIAMAALRASSGETERMRNLGIEASVQGKKIKLEFRGVTKVIDRNIVSIVQLLEEFGNMDGVLGTSTEVMNTMEGKVSNLSDAWDNLRWAMNQYASDPTKAAISFMIESFNTLAKLINPSELQAAEKNYASLGEAIERYYEHKDDWLNFGGREEAALITAMRNLGIDISFDDGATAIDVAREALKKFRAEWTKLKEEADKESPGVGGIKGKPEGALSDSLSKYIESVADQDKELFKDIDEELEYEEALRAINMELDRHLILRRDIGRLGGHIVPPDLPETLDRVTTSMHNLTATQEMIKGIMNDVVGEMSSLLLALGSGSENAAERFRKAMVNALLGVISKLSVAVALAGAFALITGGASIGGAQMFGGTGSFVDILKSLTGLKGMASGGYNASGGLTRVGENGPEIVAMPQGSRVLSRGDMMSALRGSSDKGGGDVNFHIGIDGLEGTLKKGRNKRSLLS